MSPTAIREILLLKTLRHEYLVRLVAVHLDRQVRLLLGAMGLFRRQTICWLTSMAAGVGYRTCQTQTSCSTGPC